MRRAPLTDQERATIMAIRDALAGTPEASMVILEARGTFDGILHSYRGVVSRAAVEKSSAVDVLELEAELCLLRVATAMSANHEHDAELLRRTLMLTARLS